MPSEDDQLLYIAALPNHQTRYLLGRIGRDIQQVLGDRFLPQQSENLHMTVGRFSPDALPDQIASFFQVPHQLPVIHPLPEEQVLRSDGAMRFRLFLRPSTDEIILGLCFNCAELGAWRAGGEAQMGSLIPHVTLGKIAAPPGQNIREAFLKLQEELGQKQGVFGSSNTLLDNLNRSRAVFEFPSFYLSTSDPSRLAVPHRGVMNGSMQRGK